MKIPVLLLIDVEPDPRLLDPNDPAPWLGYEASAAYFAAMRDRLAAATGSPVHFNWFFRMDPQVSDVYGSPSWPIRHYRSLLDAHIRHGDEIGLHTHAYRWEADKRRWLVDHGNPEWIDRCLDMSFTAFGEELNRSCDSFRFGDRFISTAIMNRVERLGARYELTIEPGAPPGPHIVKGEAFTGQTPDCRDAPTAPYRNRPDDWKRADPSRPSGMVVIPLSSGVPETRKGAAKRRLLHLFGRSAPAPNPLTLRLDKHAPTINLIMDRLLNETKRPYLTMLMRTDTVLKPKERADMDAIFAHVLSHRYARDFAFCTPSEAIALLGFDGEAAP